MTNPAVSVVVVSRGRPDDLARCLTGLSQVQYDPFELIVVADPEGVRAARSLTFAEQLKIVPFDEANISAARNIGIVQAAGEIVAFIDDDAVPEPQWLRYLVAPATQGDVAALAGFVRGRNGISFQWKARSLDRYGGFHPLEVHDSQATVLHPPKGKAVKTEGTNMAFRRSVLVELGGFDSAYHYFLDETDLNMRLARAGYATAVVPLAEVHHGFAANAQRRANRVPRDLFEIGASWAVFLRKHVPESERKGQWKALRAGEKRRLLEHMVTGGLDAGWVRYLMKRLDAGYRDGLARIPGAVKLPAHPETPFKHFASSSRPSRIVRSRPWRLSRDLAAARERVARGEIVTVISLSLTTLYHRIYFDKSGVWVQRGGLFGKSERHEPIWRVMTRSGRIQNETSRVMRQRGISKET
ncbi:glycosyltransferase family 2 protein [Marimonas sp. MJW-29]|uniref:Glycosyltransferase family 2 protein n=1 Tax=Sulfitobacter sediminis TaxID=3234186 RepID=A0ABV3RQI2_9RHOB